MTQPTRLLLLGLVLATLAACGGDEGGPTQPPGEEPTAPSVPEGWERSDIAGLDSTGLEIMESFPVQVTLRVAGSLPTPCHVPIWEVARTGQTVEVELFSAVDPGEVCAQVLEPFEVAIPLGSFEQGEFDVTLNGEQVGGFTA